MKQGEEDWPAFRATTTDLEPNPLNAKSEKEIWRKKNKNHSNKSEMNGEMVYGGHHSITLLSCSQSLSPARGEMMIKVTREGRCADRCSLQDDAPWQDDGRAPSSPLGNKTAPSPLLANNGTARRLANQRRGVRCKVKGKKSALRIAESRNSQNRKVTDYYPIRRSSRKSKAELKCEQKTHVDNLIINGIEEGMEVQNIVGKGRGVFTRQCFQKGQYVVEYHGDLLQVTDAQQREAEYAQNPATGCYMYYFQYACKTYCVDATRETGRMGRLINHSKNGNCQTKLHDINGVPHLILVASRDVEDGEELLYDYGDRSRASIAAHPWLKY